MFPKGITFSAGQIPCELHGMSKIDRMGNGSRTKSAVIMATPEIRVSKTKIRSVSDLAEFLGLSDWTVSRAINGSSAVKPATRMRVLEAMKETGFKPNPLALGLRGKMNGLVGVCFGEYCNPLLIEKLSILEDLLSEHGLHCVLAFTRNDKASEIQTLENLKRLRVEAIISIQSQLTEKERLPLLRGENHVHLDPVHTRPTSCVSLDRNRGMEFLIEHLVELGHRHFGLLGFSQATIWRWPGVKKALQKASLDPSRSTRSYLAPAELKSSYEIGAHLATEVLKERKPPTALLALSDTIAVAAIQRLQSEGIKVPEDFSVTGFDNLEIARHIRPTLTTVDQQPHALVKSTCDLLLRKLGRIQEPARKAIVIPPKLIPGESTGKRRRQTH